MRIAVIGFDGEAATNILLNLHSRWQDLEVTYPKSTSQVEDLDAILIGDHVLPITEQVQAVRKYWDGLLVAFTSKVSDPELVAALGAGADDYMPLTATGPAIVSRISACLRRSQTSQPKYESARVGPLYVNLETFEAFLGDDPLYLTPTEFRLLYHMARNRGRVLTHQALQDLTWGSEGQFYRNGLRKYIQRLRSKLDPFQASVSIVSVPRVGYRLEESAK